MIEAMTVSEVSASLAEGLREKLDAGIILRLVQKVKVEEIDGEVRFLGPLFVSFSPRWADVGHFPSCRYIPTVLVTFPLSFVLLLGSQYVQLWADIRSQLTQVLASLSALKID